MKTKFRLLVASVLLTNFTWAQLPAPTTLNTGNQSPTTSKPVGQNDNNWKVSRTGINGTYITAQVCGIATGPGWWATPWTPNADWITYPHKSLNPCLTHVSEAEHNCIGLADEYYKLTFNLPASLCGQPYNYCLAMKFNCDNSVCEIFINNNLEWSNPGANPATDADYKSTTGVTRTMCQFWQTGANTLIVHVKSNTGIYPDFIGFLAQVDITATTPDPCPPPAGCCLGNSCGNQQNVLPADYEIPMGGFNFYYSGDAPQKEKVNVGIACNNIMPGKFNVSTAAPSDPTAGGNGDSYSIYGINTNMMRNATNAGVYGKATVSNGEAGNNNERGVWGVADGGTDARGVFGQGSRAFNSYGGYFESTAPNPQGTNYGLYAQAAGGSLNYAGYFQGNVVVNGTGFISMGPWTNSDRRFKSAIVPLEDVSAKLMKLSGYTYKFRNTEFREKNFDEKSHIGLIAQELNEVFPQLVTEDEKGFLAVDYQGMVPVLLESAKEQYGRIESLQSQVNELKTLVQSMAGIKTSATSIPVTLSDKNAVVLNQNVPNPFAESTVITYNVPTDFAKAQIIFSNNSGTIIKTVDITVKGAGTLNVFANDLSHGIYNYSIVVDEKTIQTKKMVKD